MKSCCHQTCNMCHINHQVSTAFICDLTEPLKINDSGISAGSCHDQLRLILHRQLLDLIIIDIALIIDTIRYNVEIFSGEVHW